MSARTRLAGTPALSRRAMAASVRSTPVISRMPSARQNAIQMPVPQPISSADAGGPAGEGWRSSARRTTSRSARYNASLNDTAR